MGVIRNGIAATFLLSSSAAQSTIGGDGIVIENLPALGLVENHLRDPDGQAQVRNVASSSRNCFARFENGHVVGKNAAADEYLIPDSGVILSTGDPFDFDGNDSDKTTRDFRDDTGEPYLKSQLPYGDEVFDPCFIEFEFQCPPATESYMPTVSIDYVFGSEEYDGETHVQLDNNDAFGVFLNGKNIALLPDGPLPITVNNINSQTNAEYYIENHLRGRTNSQSPYPGIEADGLTTRLRASATPVSGWNSLKLVIGDVHDGRLDSWALLAAGSFTCAGDAAPPPTKSPPAEVGAGARPFRLPMEVAIFSIVLLGIIALVIPLCFYAINNHQRVRDEKSRRAKEEKDKKEKEKKDKKEKEKKDKEKKEKEKKEKDKKEKDKKEKEEKEKEEANRRSPLVYIYGPYVYLTNQFTQWRT